jgi:hypothetical protein
MARSKLITRNDLISITQMGGSIDSDKLNPNIITIQDTDLVNLIGKPLLDKLESDISLGVVLDPYLTLLRDYIRYYMAFSVAADFVNTGNYTIGNGGISTHNGTNTTSVNTNDVNRIYDSLVNKKMSYGVRLVKYLKDNYSLFPEYSKSDTTDSSSNFGGLYLDNY